MPPSKPACQALATAYKLAAEVTDKLSDIRTIIRNIISLKSKIRFGIVDIADAIGAEVIGAIGAVGSRVAENTLGTISKMAAGIFERIFSLLLKILLAFPTSVFSLVAIPHESAVGATKREAVLIRKAEENLRRILRIIIKWTKGKSGSDYRNQMIEALPYIITAIRACADLIHGLQGEPGEPGEFGGNAVFKGGVYNRIKANLATAIELSTPESVIEKRLEINKRLENEKQSIYNKKADAIKAKYNTRKRALADTYRENMAEAKPNSSETAPNRLADAIKEHKIAIVYKEDLETLNTWKKEKLAIAELEAETLALSNKDVWIKAFTDAGEQFIIDMKTLEDQLFDMLENIKDAYVQNKLSQLHCNTIYDMRNIISRLIEEMIAYMRDFGNASAELLSQSVDSAKSLIEVARDTYESATAPGVDLSASEYAASLTSGNGALLAADSILDSTVTDELIDIINADDVLAAEDKEFDDFIKELGLIPDWDGETGVWAVNMPNSSISPYIQLIVDITEMLAKVPVLSVRNKDSDRDRVKSLVNGVRKDFSRLGNHNNLVKSALNLYTPYIGSEAGDLMKILSRAGLLQTFANTMSIGAMVTSLAANFSDQFGNEVPNYDNCSTSYPDLFTDGSILDGSTDKALDVQDPKLEDEFQNTLEESERDKRLMYMKNEIAHADFEKVPDGGDDDLLGYSTDDPIG